MRPAPASSNRRIAAARSGPRPTTGWSMSRATTARAGRTSRPRACLNWPMSAASRSRRTTPTRSMWPRRATSWPTTGRPVQEHRRRAELEVDQRQPAEGRDQPRRARRCRRQGPALCRHRDRHPFQPRRRGDVDAHGRPAQRAGLRHEAQGQRPGGGDARPLVLDPRRRDGAARPGPREIGGRKGTRLFAPRTAIRTKLHWSAGANVRTGIAYGPAFGIDGSTVMVERPTARAFASISMSARTRRTAPSSTTGWPKRTPEPVR